MNIPYRHRITLSFVAAVLVLCVIVVSFYSSFFQMNHEKERVEHTYTVISTLQEILSNLKDVQSSQRGFVITGADDYLSPYYIAVPRVDEQLKELTNLVVDNDVQLKRAQSLAIHVNERIKTAQLIIATYKEQGQPAAMDMVRKGSGKREMDLIRTIVAEMIDVERMLLSTRRAAVERYSEVTMFAGLIGAAVCLIILAAVFFLIRKETYHRERTEETLHQAFADMERSNTETTMIARMGDYLRGCRTQDEAYGMIAGNMPAIFPNSYGSVSMFNNSRNLVQTVVTWGAQPEDTPREWEPESCWSLRQGRPHVYLNDEASPLCGHLEKVVPRQPSTCLPMQALGETIGQMLVGYEDEKKPGHHAIDTMRTVTEQIALALANLNLQSALKEQSIKDPLTKLFNRRYLEETLARECFRSERNKQTLAVLIMDIDHFKKVNDTYGHDAGDAVLVAFAKLLLSKIRKDDVACRLGGEEFVLVLPTASLELAKARAQDICDAVRNMDIFYKSQKIPITVSIGAALFPEHGDTGEQLVHHADMALYKAKQGGRDRIMVFDKLSA